MVEEEREWPDETVPANDNVSPYDARAREVVERVDRATMKLAQLIGRVMAQEAFASSINATNDNAPKSRGEPDNEAAT